jgi:hypothetical protein
MLTHPCLWEARGERLSLPTAVRGAPAAAVASQRAMGSPAGLPNAASLPFRKLHLTCCYLALAAHHYRFTSPSVSPSPQGLGFGPLGSSARMRLPRAARPWPPARTRPDVPGLPCSGSLRARQPPARPTAGREAPPEIAISDSSPVTRPCSCQRHSTLKTEGAPQALRPLLRSASLGGCQAQPHHNPPLLAPSSDGSKHASGRSWWSG